MLQPASREILLYIMHSRSFKVPRLKSKWYEVVFSLCVKLNVRIIASGCGHLTQESCGS